MANDCYKCKYRGEVPGSVHSRCRILNDPSSEFAMFLAIRSGTITTHTNDDELIEFNHHGVNNGWCDWPFNFDPVWVTCNLNTEDISNITS